MVVQSLADDMSGRWQPAYGVLGLCVAAYFAVRFSQVIVGPVIPPVQAEFGVSTGSIGIALTGMWIAYALTQLPSGVLADRIGERRVVLYALGLSAVATVGLSSAPAFPVFALAIVVLGIGAGAYYNPATALLARDFDAIGGAIGSHRIGGQVAGVVAPLLAAAVVVHVGWRTPILAGAIVICLVAGFIIWRISPRPPVDPDVSFRSTLAPRGLFDLLRRPRTRNTTTLMTMVEFVGLSAMAFLPAFLVAHQGFTLGQANLLFAGFFAVSAVCQPLGGWLSDRIGRDPTIAMLALAGTAGYATLVVGGGTLLIALAVVLSGTALSMTSVIQARMIDGLATSNRGTGFGLFRGVYLLIGATGTAVVGTTADLAGWAAAFTVLAGIMAGVLMLVVLLHISGKKPS